MYVNGQYVTSLLDNIKREELLHLSQQLRTVDLEEIAREATAYYKKELTSSDTELDQAVGRAVNFVVTSLFIEPLRDRISNRILLLPEQDERIEKLFLEQPRLKEAVQVRAKNPLTIREACNYYEFLSKKFRPCVEQALRKQIEASSISISEWAKTYFSSFGSWLRQEIS